ncbi:MAG: hypothetical protein D3905_06590, partial [Candidatus Electrothrix sp. AS4_5]|nr:hypothetical protein [Candidatus Electrothrix gigas]
MRNNFKRILAGIIFIYIHFFFVASSQAIPEFDSFDEVPFETLPSTFEAKIGGEYFILATGKENIPSGINMTAAQEIALDRAELKARGELVEFIQNGELEKTSFNSTAYSSSEGSSNSSTLN